MLKKIINLVKKDKFLFYSYLLTVSFILGAVCNLLFQYFNIKFLNKEYYSILSAFLSLQYIFAFSFGSLRVYFIYLTSKYSEDFSKIKRIIKEGLRFVFYPTVLSCFLLIFLGLRVINNYLVIFLFLISTLPALIFPILNGILTGLKRYISLFIVSLLPFILKLAIAVLLFFIGFRLLSPFIALAVSAIFGCLLILYFLKDVLLWKDSKSIGNIVKWRELVMFVVFILSLTVMISFDVYIAKLNNISYNFYVNATFGKFVFYLIGPFLSVALPYIIDNKKDYEETRTYLRKIIKNLIAVTTAAIVASILFQDLIRNILYSNKYSAALLPIMFGIYFIFSLGYLLWIYVFVISKRKKHNVIVGIISALTMLFLLLFGKTLFSFLVILSVGYGVLLLSGMIEYNLYRNISAK